MRLPIAMLYSCCRLMPFTARRPARAARTTRNLVNRSAIVFIAAWLSVSHAMAAQGPQTAAPHLEKRGTAVQLVVDGAPFLVLAGELGNSSGESAYLRPLWPTLEQLHLNTVLAPAYWELVEPGEGRFDFAEVDGLVRDARAHGMRLVLLWFASWKNSMSVYAPAWVKLDAKRFPRAVDPAGHTLDILSPFSGASRDADARAFAALMRHLREVDGERHTVVMVQVENEIGMIPYARDHSPAADARFAGAVPPALLDHLARHEDQVSPELRAMWAAQGRRRTGTWEQVFGAGRATEEVFTAWHFATYVETVAAAGKKEYPLPMFVNAALIRPGHQPGQYPSGGPLPHIAEIWKAGAPSVDFLSPDIYFTNFTEWCRRYARPGNPLFIPEALRTRDAAVNVLYAVGQHDAIGFSPFAIEDASGPVAASLADSYGMLSGLAPVILAHQGRGAMAGLMSEGPEQRQPQEVTLSGYVLRASFERQQAPVLAEAGGPMPGATPPAASPAGALVVNTARDEFLLAGTGVTVTFAHAATDESARILSVEEGRYESGRWVHVRWLNGDQTHQGRHLRLEPGRFTVQRIKLY
jgi:beta-galactosidase GanA